MIIRRRDALEFTAGALGKLEQKYGLSSDAFYARYTQGQCVTGDGFVDSYWASIYEVFLSVSDLYK